MGVSWGLPAGLAAWWPWEGEGKSYLKLLEARQPDGLQQVGTVLAVERASIRQEGRTDGAVANQLTPPPRPTPHPSFSLGGAS